jgi:hypothetical protein
MGRSLGCHDAFSELIILASIYEARTCAWLGALDPAATLLSERPMEDPFLRTMISRWREDGRRSQA